MKLTEFSLWGSDIELEENLCIELEYSKIPIKDSPSRIDCSIICIFIQGTADIAVDCTNYHMEKGMILSVFPMQIVEQIETSPDLKLMYFTCSIEILNRILFRFPPEFELFLREFPISKLPEKYYLKDVEFIGLLKEKFEEKDNVCRSELILSHIRCFCLDLYSNIHHKLIENSAKNIRRKEIVKMFIGLIMKHYKESREVAYYAKRLNITPKYLSIVSQDVNGQTAKRIIDEYIVTEIKLRMKTTTKSIQEIAEELNFPDQSFLSKYFKKQTGISPRKYRNR
jgi:AraC-like DNA-binding protein